MKKVLFFLVFYGVVFFVLTEGLPYDYFDIDTFIGMVMGTFIIGLLLYVHPQIQFVYLCMTLLAGIGYACYTSYDPVGWVYSGYGAGYAVDRSVRNYSINRKEI